MITPVIMAGGSGTRLWPLSRAGHPKQFLALNGDKTMLQQTVERLMICQHPNRSLFVTKSIDFLSPSKCARLMPRGKLFLSLWA